ncbi:hypothetical protein HYH02_005253 [Chlamydomonas schloesseri]|uniref:Uncharacterized protein n=1 Tax=Chlamydomonas schloesseri TaxID=2026947 RepID=A0A835WLP8_9CHLO|nr:hypothetical protein HYH02_005253 [Chlamydomonas schloesseri]|eukprot:KAG2449726.1 hypothetical protein HYH02_005253 [Chlamydomonas schloesseri]
MAASLHRVAPPAVTAGRQTWSLKAPVAGSLRRGCRTAAGYKARIESVNEDQSKEYKIQKLAEILYTSPETVSNIVRLRPGLLCPDSQWFEERIMHLSYRYQVPERTAAEYCVQNPALLFNRL